MPPSLRLLALALPILALVHCTLEEDFRTSAGTEVRFSTDTLRFDTVFAEVGSATRRFKIFNPYDQPLLLNRVAVEEPMGGRFSINVDGVSGDEVRDVFIPGGDSVYVFVEATVDPDDDVSVSPFVLESAVVVEATDVAQRVVLEAFGQNANYLPASRTRAGFSGLLCELGEVSFDDPKPYVLYGSLIVDSCTLVLPAGTRLYVHGGIVRSDLVEGAYNDGLVIFGPDGRLRVEGTAEDPVLIAGDRLEEGFGDRGGQYSGLRFGPGSGPHHISYAEIRNGIVGVYVDSLASVALDHTTIAYASAGGITSFAGDVTASNVLVHSCGAGVTAVLGGTHRYDYCTLANYTSRDNPAAGFQSFFAYAEDDVRYRPLDVRIRNSIVAGNLDDELIVSAGEEPASAEYAVANTLLTTSGDEEALPGFAEHCADCLAIERDSALFVDARADTFLLDTLSIAEGFALPLDNLDDDLRGAARDPERPDAGAYEYVPVED